MRKQNRLIYLSYLTYFIIFFSGCISNENTQVETTDTEQFLLNIKPDEAFNLIQNNTKNKDFIILDVRTLNEYQSEHIANAIVIDYYNETFQDEINSLDKDKTYFIYCRTGRRTGETMKIMKELGFTQVYNILGGITQWKSLGLPIQNP